MTSRPIIDVATGEYITYEEPEAPEGVDLNELPKIVPDRFKDIDHRDLSNARSMSREALLLMSSLSYDRKDGEAAMAWKLAAVENQQMATNVENAESMKALLEPNGYMPQPGSRIVASRGKSPWETSDEWREVDEKYAEANLFLIGLEATDKDYDQAAAKVKHLGVERDELQATLRDAAQSAGTWGVADERIAEAEQSLRDKAKQVEIMMQGTASGGVHE